jgi:hypothetical protein
MARRRATNPKVVLFVEGEFAPRHRGPDPLTSIWRDRLPAGLGLVPIQRLVPISKKDIVAMDRKSRLSGAGAVPLDARIVAALRAEEFDIALIAWDLLPPWNKNLEVRRCEEVVRLFRGLAGSQVLPPLWRDHAQQRVQEFEARRAGAAYPGPPRLVPNSILAVCMEPTFESLLLCCERAIRDALGVESAGRIGWPSWDQHTMRPELILQKAIQVVRQLQARPRVMGQIRGDMITAKNEWGEYFLRRILDDERCREAFLSHPIALRLRDLMDRGRLASATG